MDPIDAFPEHLSTTVVPVTLPDKPDALEYAARQGQVRAGIIYQEPTAKRVFVLFYSTTTCADSRCPRTCADSRCPTITSVQIPDVLEPVQIPLVPQSPVQIPVSQVPEPPVQIPVSQVPEPPVQIPDVPEPVQIPVSHVSEPPVQILVSQVPQSPVQIPLVQIPDVPEPVQIPVSHVSEPPVQIPVSQVPEPLCADSTLLQILQMFQNLCRFQCHKSHSHLHGYADSPRIMNILHVPQHVQILPEPVLHVSSQIPVSQVPPMCRFFMYQNLCKFTSPTASLCRFLACGQNLCRFSVTSPTVTCAESPKPMQLLPELDILDPLESTDAFDQLMSFCIWTPRTPSCLVPPIFGENLFSPFLDEFEREPMDLTMPR
ncbi:uncharacterized protein TNCV_1851351, partial [Trichonephila clavipes]